MIQQSHRGIISREKQGLKGNMHPYANYSAIYNIQKWKKPKCPSTDERIKKMWLIYRHPWQLSWQRIHLQCKKPWFDSWVGKIPWRRDRLHTPVFLVFSGGSAGKESACNAGNLGSVPRLGRSSGERKGYPLRNSGLENSMDCIGVGHD